MTQDSITIQTLDFINRSPSCFHAVENLKTELEALSFNQLFENKKWDVKAAGKYFVTRNGSSIISVKIPSKTVKGFLITASHSDSPCFKIKENPELKKSGCVCLNVEKYGGMLMNPWFDRPLSIAGRAIISEEENGTIKVSQKLVNFDRNLCMIPNLAIHMNRDANDGHRIDVQNEICPVISTEPDFSLLNETAALCGVKSEQISGLDLYLYNRDKGTFWGAENQFISSPKLDDLECVYTTFKGFAEAENDEYILIHAVFDNEETGSQSRQGAASTFLADVLKRLNSALGRSEEDYLTAVANSFLVSADNAHAVHPNFAGSADPVNRPKVNCGPVIKFNAAQKYTSDGISASVFKKICEKAQVPYQIFTNNSNQPGGSTLGNISTSQVSVLSVDIGLAQWAMHSPNESAGALDPVLMQKAILEFYKSSIQVE